MTVANRGPIILVRTAQSFRSIHAQLAPDQTIDEAEVITLYYLRQRRLSEDIQYLLDQLVCPRMRSEVAY
jgi:hypothetical protein